MQKGFTLIEMLIVMGIIAILIGAGIGSYSHMTRRAQQAQGRELVANTATALNLLFQKFGNWPKALRNEAGSGAGRLRARPAACLAVNKLMSLTYTTMEENGEKIYTLAGNDRYGIVTPWAQAVIKRSNGGEKVPSGGTIDDHVLYYALDLTGEGFVEANVGGTAIKVRSNAIVWCAGMDGVLEPYPYAGGSGKGSGKSTSRGGDDIYSWSPMQVER